MIGPCSTSAAAIPAARTTATGVRLVLVTAGLPAVAGPRAPRAASRPVDTPLLGALWHLSRGLPCRAADAFRALFRATAAVRAAGVLPERVRDLLLDGASPPHVEAVLCAAVRETVRREAAALAHPGAARVLPFPRPAVPARADRRRRAASPAHARAA